MDDIYFKTLVMHIAQGLLSGQASDRTLRYFDSPDMKKEVQLANDAFLYAKAIMNKFTQQEE